MARPTPDIWNHVLSLMAAVVLSDKRIREDEIKSFIKNARLMARELNQELDLSDELLQGWFEAKREGIAKQLTGGNADAFFVENIIALEPFAPKQVLLNCLISISASDAELHHSEVDLVNLAAAYWELI